MVSVGVGRLGFLVSVGRSVWSPWTLSGIWSAGFFPFSVSFVLVVEMALVLSFVYLGYAPCLACRLSPLIAHAVVVELFGILGMHWSLAV